MCRLIPGARRLIASSFRDGSTVIIFHRYWKCRCNIESTSILQLSTLSEWQVCDFGHDQSQKTLGAVLYAYHRHYSAEHGRISKLDP